MLIEIQLCHALHVDAEQSTLFKTFFLENMIGFKFAHNKQYSEKKFPNKLFMFQL